VGLVEITVTGDEIVSAGSNGTGEEFCILAVTGKFYIKVYMA
jgi:hypothetical protein